MGLSRVGGALSTRTGFHPEGALAWQLPGPLWSLLDTSAARGPEACALSAPGRQPLSHAQLLDHLHRTSGALRALGIDPSDRVAIVLPQGPELATASLAVALNAACAPLNPAYRATEYEFFLADLCAKALILRSDSDSPARAAAQKLGIPIIGVAPVPEGPAGLFVLTGCPREGSTRTPRTTADHVALVLYTSGTTARPKLVPLSQANLAASASNIATTLDLAAGDRCLNVMPLFHIHGIMVLLASLAAGASAVCPPPFDGPAFFAWLDEFRPTWYSAVPTIHQAVLKQAPSHRETIGRRPLRFIRSSSASLPVWVANELEAVFRTPVVQAYGMTEAAHQITSNPLPPLTRKHGSVGLPAGSEVAILDGAGNQLPSGATGEVAIRGANVTHGYERHPEDEARPVEGGWFRTGDQGHIDADGYLFLEGRLKELINRGGEKIAPAEVDNVLLEHPAVAQAVTFAVSHPTLGEDVSAAVVLREGVTATERELRLFAADRLADVKIPRRIVIVPQIPEGPTGKLARGRLGEALGLTPRPEGEATMVAPRSPLERQLVGIWEQVLDHQRVGVRDSFFDLGGDSLLASQMMRLIEHDCGLRLPVTALIATPTIEDLAQRMVHDVTTRLTEPISQIQAGGNRLPLFFLHGDITTGGLYSLRLARALGRHQPVYAVHPHGLCSPVPDSIAEIAADHIRALRVIQPHGPYRLAGVCKGALAAFEMAQQLRVRGEQIDTLILIDPPETNTKLWIRALHAIVETLPGLAAPDAAERAARFASLRARGLALESLVARLLRVARSGLREPALFMNTLPAKLRARLRVSRASKQGDTGENDIAAAHRRAIAGYVPRRLRGAMTLLRSADCPLGRWTTMADHVTLITIPLAHHELIGRHIEVIGQRVRGQLSGV